MQKIEIMVIDKKYIYIYDFSVKFRFFIAYNSDIDAFVSAYVYIFNSEM